MLRLSQPCFRQNHETDYLGSFLMEDCLRAINSRNVLDRVHLLCSHLPPGSGSLIGGSEGALSPIPAYGRQTPGAVAPKPSM